jgi:hypothetical protein
VKIDELTARVGGDKIGVQVLNHSVTAAKQKKDGVALTFETDCVSMKEVYSGEWENVVFIVRVKREDFEAAVAASKAAESVDDEATMRAAFEAWAVKQPKHVIKDIQRYAEDYRPLAGQYGHCDTRTAWDTWQAAWKALRGDSFKQLSPSQLADVYFAARAMELPEFISRMNEVFGPKG